MKKQIVFLAIVVLITACTTPTAIASPDTISTPVCSPILYGNPTRIATLSTTGSVHQMSSADFNGDGLMDLVFARGTYPTSDTHELNIALNDGNGGFVLATSEIFINTVPRTQHPRQIVLADFNGDGITDIFVADHGQDVEPFPGYPNTLVLSTGDGKLMNAAANIPQQPDYSHSAAAADIDSDGDIDLFIGNTWGQAQFPPQIWINNGDGVFSVSDGRLPPDQANLNRNVYTASRFVDVNNDGAPDLILGANEITIDSVVLLNDGTGVFSLLPNAFPPKPLHWANIAVYIQPADVNGDAYQDLMVVYTIGWAVSKPAAPDYEGRYIQILINNGDGTFRDETATRLPQVDNDDRWVMDIALVDLDHDGDLDITTRTGWIAGFDQVYYLNDGHGFYCVPKTLQNVASTVSYLYTFIDLDGDGGLDTVSVGYSGGFWLMQDVGCRDTVHQAIECAPPPTASPPTLTLTPGPTAPYIIYTDGLAAGWSLDPWGGQADAHSSRVVYQGSEAIEITLQPSIGITFDTRPPLDIANYTYLVFYLNGGDTADQQLYVEMKSGDNVPLGERAYLTDSTFVEGYPLQPGQWHRVTIPLSFLNREGVPFAWFDIGDASGNGTSTFYIDEIQLVGAKP